MSLPRATIEEAKARLDVAALWKRLNLPGEPSRSCRCPMHKDRNASFSVYTGAKGTLRWKCHSQCGEGGPVEFLARVLDINEREACRRIVEMAFGESAEHLPVRPPQAKAPVQPRHLVLPVGFTRGSESNLRDVAALRGLSLEGVELASSRGLLWFAPARGYTSWIITDSKRTNAQARKVDGGVWEHIGGAKAWTLPGSRAAWPIGAREAVVYPYVALVEGGTDLLAAHHFITAEGRQHDVCAVAILGASNNIPENALPFLKDKRVRIYPHDDPAGQAAAVRWTAQLEAVGCKVDAFRLTGLVRRDGKPVKDLNDLVSVDPVRSADPVIEEVLPA